jgi:hypothetical protein
VSNVKRKKKKIVGEGRKKETTITLKIILKVLFVAMH